MPLAIPTLASEVPGNYIPSALWNANVYNGLTYAFNPPSFVGTQQTVQSIPTASWFVLGLDTTQTDPYAGHSNVTNNSRWTCPTGVPGWYTVCGVAAFSLNGTGARAARIQVNGSPVAGGCTFIPTITSNAPGICTPTRDVFLNVGDYVEIGAWQNSGGGLNTTVNSDLCSALWLRFSHA